VHLRLALAVAAAFAAVGRPAQDGVHFLPADRVATRNMRTVPAVDVAPGVHVRTVVGTEASFSFAEFDPGSAAVLHHHTREQADIALDGVFDMTLAGRVERLGPGAGVIVPPDVEHSIRNATSTTLTVIEFHTVRRPDLVPPRPALTFPASAAPVDIPGGRTLVRPLQELARKRADRRAAISGETCTLTWRTLARGSAAAAVNSTPDRTERFVYVLKGDAVILDGSRTEPAPAGTLIVVPARLTQQVRLKAGRGADVVLAEFGLRAAEKDLRTAAQRKINSQVLYEIYRARGEAKAKRVPPGPTGVRIDKKQRALVDVRADVTSSLQTKVRVLGGTIVSVSTEYKSVIAWVPLKSLERLAGEPAVLAIEPAAEAIVNKKQTEGR
jgi:mannose-6-phosphate isomerase-like protein (cupin superfamily)